MPDHGPIVVCLFVCLSIHHNDRINPKGGSDLNLRMGLGSAPQIWHPGVGIFLAHHQIVAHYIVITIWAQMQYIGLLL